MVHQLLQQTLSNGTTIEQVISQFNMNQDAEVMLQLLLLQLFAPIADTESQSPEIPPPLEVPIIQTILRN
jgi:hypothetical protein